jgi:DNA-binding CsgD family transcriptional regulator
MIMLKDFLKYYLDIGNQEKELEEIKERLGNLEQKVDEYDQDLGEEVETLKEEVYNMRPATRELTDRERELLSTLLNSEKWLEKEDISDKLDISKNYVGTLISDLRDKEIELVSKKLDSNNKKAYRLSDSQKKEIDGLF